MSGLLRRHLAGAVHPIRLDNAVFEGDNVVYLLDPPDGPTTLVDAGVPTPAVREDLREGLAAAGVGVADLDRILLTHWHWDHSGLAGELQAESGASVHVHERDAPLVDGSGRAAFEALRRRCFEQWGVPDGPLAELTDFLDRHADLAGDPADVTPFSNGERFPLGEDALRAVHLPGHADGLTAFCYEGRHEAFVGDVLLPEYTPNVGGADPRVERPLATYTASLRWLATAEFDRVWPGHRDPIDDPAGRAEAILAHHEERTTATRDVLSEVGPATPWAVSAELFGDLEGIHVMHGPGEAWAHLEHLVEADDAERRTVDGVLEYRLP